MTEVSITQTELGNRLAIARQRSGLTQEQVAKALELTRTAITHLESGNRQVSSLELVKLGRVFGVDVRDLLEGRDPNAELLALFRSKSGPIDSATEQAVKETLPLCRIVSDLQDILDEHDSSSLAGQVTVYPAKALAGTSRQQGQQLARLERERLGLGCEPIPDLSLLVLRHGVIVAEHELPEGVSGVFLNVRKGRSFILLQTEEGHGRKRFSLAHEYCHALVDSHEMVIVSREKAGVARELRANAFASAFLLPMEGILQHAIEEGVTPSGFDFTHVAKLSVRFGVSFEATVVALDLYQLISADQKRVLLENTRRAQGYIRSTLNFQEPQFNRTTLREWAFQRMLKALELGLISVRKAVSVAKDLGYDAEVVHENLSLLTNEVRE